MSISSLYPESILIPAAGLNPAGPSGTLELLDSVPTINESGWDTLRRQYLYLNEDVDSEIDAANLFEIGDQIDSLNAYCVGSTAKAKAPGVFLVDVTAHGLLEAAKAEKIRYTSRSNQQSGNNILDDTSPTPVLRSKVVAHENQVVCTRSFILIGSLPDTDLVATAQDPPDAPGTSDPPAVKTTVWSWLPDPTYHYPNGWVLMDLDADTIAGTNVHLVTEVYEYIHEFSA